MLCAEERRRELFLILMCPTERQLTVQLSPTLIFTVKVKGSSAGRGEKSPCSISRDEESISAITPDADIDPDLELGQRSVRP